MRKTTLIMMIALTVLAMLGCTTHPYKALKEFSAVGEEEATAHLKNDQRIMNNYLSLFRYILTRSNKPADERMELLNKAVRQLTRNVEQSKENLEMWTELRKFLKSVDPRKLLKFMRKKLEMIKRRLDKEKKANEKREEKKGEILNGGKPHGS